LGGLGWLAALANDAPQVLTNRPSWARPTALTDLGDACLAPCQRHFRVLDANAEPFRLLLTREPPAALPQPAGPPAAPAFDGLG
jgi:hypothetical protein